MAQVKSGDTVKVHYTGKLDDGSVFDTSVNREALELIIGDNQLIAAFEEGLIGMSPGESKTIEVSSEEAFGPYHEEMVTTVDRSELPDGLEPQLGQRLSANGEDGESITVFVTEVGDSSVTLDANHPLAGEDLTFDVELVEIL